MGFVSKVYKIAVATWGNNLMPPKEMEKMKIRLLFES